MTIMSHALDLIRVNLCYVYINYNSLVEEEYFWEQKYFVMEMVDKILEISTTLGYSFARSVNEKCLKGINRTLSKRGGLGLNTNTPRFILIQLRDQHLKTSLHIF